jgi:hypothetical protein
MDPRIDAAGAIFVLENAGRVGEKDDPDWAVLSCPERGTLSLITRKQLTGLLRVSQPRSQRAFRG